MEQVSLLEIEDAVIRLDRTAESSLRLHVPRFTLKSGGLVALVGPSGAGKTTFLEYLAALRPAESIGRHCLTLPQAAPIDLSRQLLSAALDPLAYLRSGPIGYVAQAGALIPFLDARANAMVNLNLCGEANDPVLRRRFDGLVQRLALCAHMKKDRSQLSGGQRKRVALLRGLARPRALVLLDEPFAGLESAMAAEVLELIISIAAAENTSFVVVTHDHAAALAKGFSAYHVQPSETKATILPGIATENGTK
jgi:putative ABC transport system ATP-binding protein